MKLTFLKVAIRNLLKHKSYSFINIFGLMLGMVCCLLILLFVGSELKYDRFHQEAERIYRVISEETGERGTAKLATTNTPLAPLLATEFPEIEAFVRLVPYAVSVKTDDGRLLQEDQLLFCDSTMFSTFSFPLVHGDARTALMDPFSVVLTKEGALKYFGSLDVVGRLITIEAKHLFKVTGVLETLPMASSIRFQVLANIRSATSVVGPWFFEHWHHPPMHTFVRLAPGARSEVINARLGDFVNTRLGEKFWYRSYRLQPLVAIHLTPDLRGELVPTTSPAYVYMLLALALFIIILACINFTNLTTARSLSRAREIGLRKVLGAQRRELIQQFLGESMMYAFIALVIAFALLEFLIPTFTSLSGKQVDTSLLTHPLFILSLILLTFGVGLAAGAYPAFVLSRFQPVRVLRGEAVKREFKGRGRGLRASLVVLQFSISAALIISTIVIHSQLSFLQKKNPGFNKEQVLVIPVRDDAIQQNYARVKTSLLALPGVSSVTALSNFPWERGFYGFPVKVEGRGKEFETDASTVLVDEDFLRTLGMDIVAGRDFLGNSQVDATEAFIINETAVKTFGFDDPVGMKLTMQSVASGQPKKGEVIGVVRDFHFRSMHHAIEPVVMTIAPVSYYLDNVVLRLTTDRIAESLRSLEAQWRLLVPDRPFEFFFLDQAFDDLYRSEERLGWIFNTFSVLAVVIACLGLFGLASFTVQQRTKEIGIRKVLGASAAGVVGMLSLELVKLVLLANLIAWPIAWYVMSGWLEGFAYRIGVEWWAFLVVGATTVCIALLSVGAQATRAALTNPVESLRYE